MLQDQHVPLNQKLSERSIVPNYVYYKHVYEMRITEPSPDYEIRRGFFIGEQVVYLWI